MVWVWLLIAVVWRGWDEGGVTKLMHDLTESATGNDSSGDGVVEWVE